MKDNAEMWRVHVEVNFVMILALVWATCWCPNPWASAGDYEWSAAVDGNFRDHNNWYPSNLTYPDDITDTAIFNRLGTYTVAFNADWRSPTITNKRFYVVDGTVHFDLTTVDTSSNYHPVTYQLDPPIDIGGNTLAASVTSLGRLTQLVVGGQQGLSTRYPNVSADGALWIAHEPRGFARVQIGDTILGPANWTSTWPTIVGGEGSGSLVVRQGTLTNSLGVLAADSGSSGIATIENNGAWVNTGNLIIGDRGPGLLRIEGGTVSNDADARIAVSPGNYSNVEISAGGTWDCNASLFVGGDSLNPGGNGAIILNDGAINVSQDVTVWPAGKVLVNEGGIDIGGAMTIDHAELFLADTSSWVSTTGQGVTNLGGTVTGSGYIKAPFPGNPADLGLMNLGGIVAPGDASGDALGTLTVLRGDFIQDDEGTLQIELAGTAGNLHDWLDVNVSDAYLDGNLDVRLVGPYMPQLGDRFHILTASGSGGVTGRFDTLPSELPPLTPGLVWNIAYEPYYVVLEVTTPAIMADFNGDHSLDCADINQLVATVAAGQYQGLFDLNGDGSVDTDDVDRWLAIAGGENLPSGNPYLPGDVNLDGVVDGADFNEWNSHKFTSLAAWCSGDLNADGNIDASDFNIWNTYKFTSALDGLRPVSEPAGWIGLGFVLCALARRRGHDKS